MNTEALTTYLLVILEKVPAQVKVAAAQGLAQDILRNCCRASFRRLCASPAHGYAQEQSTDVDLGT